MKQNEVQTKVFGERKDFDSGQTESSFSYASKSVRGLNSDDATFGVFKTSNKALGIKAGQSTGPADGPNWRQTMLTKSDLDNWTDENPAPNLAQDSVSQSMQAKNPNVWSKNQKGRKARRKEALKNLHEKRDSQKFLVRESQSFVPLPKVDGKGKANNMLEHAENVKNSALAKPLKAYSKREAYIAEREEQVERAMKTYIAKPKGVATGKEVLNSKGTTRAVKEAQARALGYGQDLSGELALDQERRILANIQKASKPTKKLVSVSTGKAVDTERDSQEQRKKFALHRENAKQMNRRSKYLRAKARTEPPKSKGIKGFGVDKQTYEKAIAQVGEHAEAAQELLRFVPEHSRSWNKSGLRNPAQTHKRKQA